MTIPTPYYTNGKQHLFFGDCHMVLPQLVDVSVDILVTDPPYGQAYKSNRGQHRMMHGDDNPEMVKQGLAFACKMLKRGHHAYVFGPELLLPETLTARCELIWNKQIVGMGDLTLPWSESHERITFAVQEISKANRAKGYGRLAARMRQGSVLDVQRVQSVAGLNHPTEKPVLLLRYLIESSSVIGDVVLDPYCGIGSTLVAAQQEDRQAYGVEINERFCEVAAKRLESESK